MAAPGPGSIDLDTLRTKLEILVNNANKTTDTASPEVMSYFRDLQGLWNRSYADPGVQDVIRSVLLSRFMSGGKFLHEYASGTIGDMLTSCFSMNGVVPADIQSCLPACLFGITPSGLPHCGMQVWREGSLSASSAGAGRILPVNAIPGQPIIERSAMANMSQYADHGGTALVILRSRASLDSDDIAALRQAGINNVRTMYGTTVSDTMPLERAANQSSGLAKFFWILLFLVLVFVGLSYWHKYRVRTNEVLTGQLPAVGEVQSAL